MPIAWTGPFLIRDLLNTCINDNRVWPPCERGVYIVTVKRWNIATGPTVGSRPLYVGGNTGKGGRFCTRIGDVIADMFGFFGESTGHSCGGKKLHNWCRDYQVNPSQLFIGWADRRPWCPRCAEIEAIGNLIGAWDRCREVGLLNEKRPPRCTAHDRRL
jgi:hypothetical protein